MLNALFQVEDHENHVRWIYLTTALNMGDSRRKCGTVSYNNTLKSTTIMPPGRQGLIQDVLKMHEAVFG